MMKHFQIVKVLIITLKLPMYIRTIGKYAFFNCWGFIGNLITPDKVTSIGYYCFCNCYGFNGTLTLSNLLKKNIKSFFLKTA